MSFRPLQRRNYAGRSVTLAEGLAVWLTASVGASRAPARLDGPLLCAIGGLGLIDDIVEPLLRSTGKMPAAKGLRGHFAALARGEVTTGAVKALGMPVLSLVVTAAAPTPHGPLQRGVNAALIAGCANLANLLDLRPGRALKAVLPAAIFLARTAQRNTGRNTGNDPSHHKAVQSGKDAALLAAGLSIIALPIDLREKGMLGDTGANTLGALLGIAAGRVLPLPASIATLAGVAALTLLSEKVSFSRIIAEQPLLATIDGWGRLPTASPQASPGAEA